MARLLPFPRRSGFAVSDLVELVAQPHTRAAGLRSVAANNSVLFVEGVSVFANVGVPNRNALATSPRGLSSAPLIRISSHVPSGCIARADGAMALLFAPNERMPFRAGCRVASEGRVAPVIGGVGDWLQVVRVHAGAVPAQMVDDESFCDGSVSVLVAPPVGVHAVHNQQVSVFVTLEKNRIVMSCMGGVIRCLRLTL